MNYYNDNTIVFLNNEFILAKEANTSIYSQTMHYGMGVFEGIRSYETSSGVKIFKGKEHYERLKMSAEKMHIPCNYSVDQMIDFTYEVLKRNNLSNAYIRPIIFLGPNMSLTPGEDSQIMICAWDWGKYLGTKLLSMRLSSYRRPDPKSCHVEAKVTGHYINSILATAEAKKNGFDDALLLDANGNVAEAPGANFFIQKNNKLYTAPLGNILPGITRKTIIDLARNNGFDVIEKYFTIEEARNADGAFITGTALEIAGITKLDNNVFPLKWEETIGFKLSEIFNIEKLK